MASKGKNLSKEEQFPISNPKKIKIGIVVSQWNKTITDRLLNGAKSVLLNSKIPAENMYASFEVSFLCFHGQFFVFVLFFF